MELLLRNRMRNLIELCSKAVKAWLAISVVANSDVGRKRIRATSRATFPWKVNTSILQLSILQHTYQGSHPTITVQDGKALKIMDLHCCKDGHKPSWHVCKGRDDSNCSMLIMPSLWHGGPHVENILSATSLHFTYGWRKKKL